MAGTGIMTGICISPYPIEKVGDSPTQLKKSGISHTHTNAQSMWGFLVKTGTGSDNTHGAGLFAISRWWC